VSGLSDEFTVTTPIDGSGRFSLVKFSGTEGLSRLFQFQLELISSNTAVAASDLVGLGVTLSISQGLDAAYRPFHGIVSRLVVGGLLDGARSYVLQLVPWFWLLTRTADCRIFQNQTSVQIIQAIFGEMGFSDYQLNLSGSYVTREYCVQYRETDFQFISRLLEDEGISYFFSHENGKHTMVLIDDAGGYVDCAENQVVHIPIAGREQPSDRIITWQRAYEMRSGKFTLTDYDFTKPTNNLLSQTPSSIPLNLIKPYEIYDYPGGYLTTQQGGARSRSRVEADESAYDVVRATGTYRSFTTGGKFTVKRHPDTAEVGQSYAIASIEHDASRAEGYRNRFEAIPAATVYRPPLQTPRPRIHGAQTARVVGPSGEEIWPDKYGRIKVLFHWDRLGKGDDTSSCWIRCAQSWTGSAWGTLFIPRVGQEVVVTFLEGDPDQPLIAGTVANASEMPAYTLPDNKTRSYIKSRSSQNGAAADSNEIRFEDLKDSEEIYIHAQKDCNRIVENNDTLAVGSSNADDGSQTITIYKDRSLTVKSGNETVSIEQGNRTVTISKGNDSLTISQGNLSIDITAGSGTIEAGQTITLKVGASSVEVSQQGVTIKGPQVSVQGTAEVQVQAPSTQVTGSGTLVLSGGIVNIN
jgi:type VI secretion system secreted protein VgrG